MRGAHSCCRFAIYFAPYYVFGISLTPDSSGRRALWHSSSTMPATLPKSIAQACSPSRARSIQAAEVLGYSRVQTFLYIVMPQVAKRILPAMGNEIHPRWSRTSLAFAISVGEMFSTAKGAGRLAGEHGAVCDRGADFTGSLTLWSRCCWAPPKKLDYYR